MERNRAWGFLGGFNAEKQSLGIPGGPCHRQTTVTDLCASLHQEGQVNNPLPSRIRYMQAHSQPLSLFDDIVQVWCVVCFPGATASYQVFLLFQQCLGFLQISIFAIL